MAAYIFDIDGTIVEHHTNTWLEGAKEYLEKLANEGHQLIFITGRGKQDNETDWNMNAAVKLLQELDCEYRLLMEVESPRYLIDDKDIFAFKRERNKSYKNGV